ncbi:MAG: AI-2E family transporter, partial [Actinophytocola sp.]|nr:AI-2E family transporter [Actinophytocola sp.]
ESNVFAPLVLGKMARIHPLAVVLAITVGVLAGGILGGIVAVPVVAVANSVGKYLAATRVTGHDTELKTDIKIH